MRSQRQLLAREWSRMHPRDRAMSKAIHQFKGAGPGGAFEWQDINRLVKGAIAAGETYDAERLARRGAMSR